MSLTSYRTAPPRARSDEKGQRSGESRGGWEAGRDGERGAGLGGGRWAPWLRCRLAEPDPCGLGGPRGWASWRTPGQTWRRPALPPLFGAVPWARRGFTAEFGMGSGGARALWSPGRARSPSSEDRCQMTTDQVGASRAPDVARHRSELVVKLGAWGQRSVVRSWPPALSAGRRRLLSSGASAPGEVSREALGHGRRPPRLAANRRLAGGGRRVQEPRPAGARSENPLRVGYRPSAYLSPLRAWGWVRARHSSD